MAIPSSTKTMAPAPSVHGGVPGTLWARWQQRRRVHGKQRLAGGEAHAVDGRSIGNGERRDFHVRALDSHAQKVVDGVIRALRRAIERGAALLDVDRRAAATRDEVAHTAPLHTLVGVVVAGEDRAHAVLLEQRQPLRLRRAPHRSGPRATAAADARATKT